MDFSVLFGLLTAGAGLVFGRPRKGGAGDAWQTAAETYGLLHKPSSFWSGPKLSGLLSGNELTVEMKNRSTASAETRFRLGIPSLNLGLRLRKKGFWNSLGPRMVTGDKVFDSQVVVDGRNDFAVREFLTPERRAEIQSFLRSFKGAVVTDDEISFKTRGYVRKSDEMLGALDAMMRVARVLSEAAAPAATDTVDTVAPEPEPADPPAEGPDEPTEPGVETTAPSDPPLSRENALRVEEFCAAVFAPGALSFSANQRFRESYEGERIAWTGTLESISPFMVDFGTGSGTKAVLTILEGQAAGARNVQAVIGLPPGIEGLDDRIGQAVSFTGRLLKVDGLARRVVIADAELLLDA